MKAATATGRVRCAIYTRVSTDQGLDQDFNSLDRPEVADPALAIRHRRREALAIRMLTPLAPTSRDALLHTERAQGRDWDLAEGDIGARG